MNALLAQYDLPDTILGTQWIPQRADNPELALRRAVLDNCWQQLKDGIDVAGHPRGKQAIEEAVAWILKNEWSWPYSFVQICTALDLDIEATRTGLLWHVPMVFRVTPLPAPRPLPRCVLTFPQPQPKTVGRPPQPVTWAHKPAYALRSCIPGKHCVLCQHPLLRGQRCRKSIARAATLSTTQMVHDSCVHEDFTGKEHDYEITG